jgi:hypothetical protein
MITKASEHILEKLEQNVKDIDRVSDNEASNQIK